MAGTAVFQSGTLATPGAGIVVATDAVSGTQYQLVKLDIGPAGSTIPVAYGGTGLPLGTLPGGTIQVHGTLQALGTVQTHGTSQVLGTVQPLAGSVHLASRLPGTADIGTVAGTVSILGTVQTHGTSQVLGTLQPLAGSVHPAAALPGTSHITGTVQPLAGSAHLATNLAGGTVVAVGSALHGAAADGRPLLMAAFGSSGTQAAIDDGDAVRLWADLNGRLQVRGTIDSLPVISGTVQTHGTTQALGTVQPLAGSVHPAAALPGTSHITGTVQPLAGSVHLASGTVQVLGTLQTHGTTQALGTFQPLAGSAHLATNLAGGTVVAVGSALHGAAADTRPLLIAAFGSSGTQAAVDDGDATRLWSDLNGRLQVRGTIDSMPAVTGTVQTHGTSQVLGTVRALVDAGTVQALGTFQPLAGSVHLATNLAGGTVVSVGSAVHGAVADTRPHLISAFGSSGTQAAIDDGDAVRLWADLNGRLQVRGTIDSIPAIVITSGTVSLNTGGTVHIGSVQSVAGTVQVLGSVQAVGTVNIGTVQGTVQVRPAGVAGESFIGTIFTGAAFSTAAVLVNPAAGTFVRLFDVLISGSASGTARLEFGSASGTLFAPLTISNAGGWSFNSSRGVLSPGTSKGLYFSATAGTWGVMINYTLEN